MPSLKPGNEKKPPTSRLVDLRFRPQHSFEHLVSDGENWTKLGSRYKVPVEEIITSNFKTLVPEEINWYLREYVNCDKPTPDRYNWRFSTSSRRGPSPRAGTIFIQPNWGAIEAAARSATRDLVLAWFNSAFIRSAPVMDGALIIRNGTVEAEAHIRPPFQQRLRDGGAPDVIAKSWEFVLRRSLELFTFNLSEIRSDAFAVDPRLRSAVPVAPPWPLLMADTADGAVRAPFFNAIVPLSMTSDPEARKAVQRFGKWFEEAFRVLRMNAVATNVQGIGVIDPRSRRYIGRAVAPPGFLTNLIMPE